MSYQSKYTGAEIDAGIDTAKAALPKNGGTMLGTLILAGDPADENGAVTKKYVDNAVNNIALTPGENGVSVSHSWNGTVLTVTSASGTSSADLKGEKGDTGEKGDKGEKGDTGAQGEKGEKGDTGATGAQGEKGADGQAGADGFSPTVAVSTISGGHRVTITDAEGAKSFDVMDGEDGSGGSGGSGADGEDGATFYPAVSSDGVLSWSNDKGLTNPDPVNIKGEKGDTGAQGEKGEKGDTGATGAQGEKGADGEDGVSPIVAVTEITDGHRVTITDASGTKSFDVMNGEDGKDNTSDYTETDPTVPDWAKAETKPSYNASEIYGIVDLIYPVGSIYMSVNAASPATLFGGTWEQIKDRFLLSAGDTYTAGTTGGETEHVLTIDEMPSHNHQLGYTAGTVQKGSNYGRPMGYNETSALAYPSTYVGGSAAHNNMPPYLTVYMWKRTA